jgi:Big-like domain-containing protein
MVRNVRRATLVALSGLVLLIVPAGAQALPPACPNASLSTTPGQRIALAASPCTDPESDPYTLAVVTQPVHGTIVPENGTNYYTPSPGYHGLDEFTYQAIVSPTEQSNVATVQILIDTAPTCTDTSATVQTGKTLTLSGIPCDDADGDNFDLFLGDPQHGTLDISASGLEAIYTPAPGYVGTDTIAYQAQDPFGQSSAVRALTITVTAPPPPPPPASTASSAASAPKDTTPPNVALISAIKNLRTALSKGLRLVLTTSEGGTATVTLKVDRATARKLKLNLKASGPVKVGSLQTTLVPGRATVTVKLTAKARKAIKKVHKVKLFVTVLIIDAAGNSATRTMTVTLKR